MWALNVRPPDYYTRATDFIPDIISAVGRLLEAGVAYESGGSVYYAVDARPEFGELSHLPRDEMLPVANERGNNPDDPRKRDPLDFVLWQAQAPGEPAWDSPWGPGRPGWHIECSTMSTRLLGSTIDIHGDGGDLIFPHPECEIAQAEPVTYRRPFVRFWMHAAMVYHEGEKMSKSLGNLVMVRDLLKTWSPDAIRLYLASHYYRRVWSHDEAELRHAERIAGSLREAVKPIGGSGDPLDPSDAMATFVEAMNDDLAAMAAIPVLERLAWETLEAAYAGQDVRLAQETLRAMSRVFGLRLDAAGPEERVVSGWGRHLERFPTG
jgi:L-cysteine:1D-myo-inositol 2-amino-2-deoxy-alpha-D-glucopyranoside ligase